MVPDLSERCTTVMSRSGRSTFGFCFLMASSFHLVILPSKILAMVSASMFRVLPLPDTPCRLKTTAIGEM